MSGGILLKVSNPPGMSPDIIGLKQPGFYARLRQLGLDEYADMFYTTVLGEQYACFRLRDTQANDWAAHGDTTQLSQKLDLDMTVDPDNLEREILLAMLSSPVPFIFPNHAELASSVRIRINLVLAARKTTLDFNTSEAERPSDYWTYDEHTGFTILPGKSLITALQKAIQPSDANKRYSFSCYRATEYVILLAIAQELDSCNSSLLQRLQLQWEKKAIMSGQFHDIFLREYGSMEHPLPPKFYVPGDRLWFRNPDEHSSDVTGYEGSWVFYLGGGLFTNFWKSATPYTLTSKCLEIYHWRNATFLDTNGELQINESIVEERVKNSLQNPAEVEIILDKMLRLRDPKGIYQEGGCIDTSREYPRCVCPGTAEIALTLT